MDLAELTDRELRELLIMHLKTALGNARDDDPNNLARDLKRVHKIVDLLLQSYGPVMPDDEE